MATRTVAEYLTPGGAVVTVTEKTLLGLFDLTFTTDCGGCKAGTTESTSFTPAETAEAAAIGWAERHAVGCRRLPVN